MRHLIWLVLLFCQLANGLKCYSCSSETDCKESSRNELLICRSESLGCMTARLQLETSVVKQRSCWSSQMGCFNSSEGLEVCACQTDGCNCQGCDSGTTPASASKFSVVSLVILAFFL